MVGVIRDVSARSHNGCVILREYRGKVRPTDDTPGVLVTPPQPMRMRHVSLCTVLWSLTLLVPRAAPSEPQTPIQAPALSTTAASVRDWKDRLISSDPGVRTAAEAALADGAERSLPLLRRFLADPHQDLTKVTFEIIRRIGPPAIPMLAELLRDQEWTGVRQGAADALIDLAPETASIQPALRQALNDKDSKVAGDAARALGALGPKASPSVGALVKTLSHADTYVRVYAAEALASIGARCGGGHECPRAGDRRSGSRRAVGGL
jgi:hypothetical protein